MISTFPLTLTPTTEKVVPDDDDDVYLKKDHNNGITKLNPTQKCRPAKGISKRVNIQIIKNADITEQLNNE
jgi:hypothetical protein